MALLNASELTPEAQRDEALNAAFNGRVAKIKGFATRRRITTQVYEILRKVECLFIPGTAGFRLIGIDPIKADKVLCPTIDGKINPNFNASKMMAFAPKVAEVIALLICTDEEVDAAENDVNKLKDLTRAITRTTQPLDMMNVMLDVKTEFDHIHNSSAVLEDDDSLPSSGITAIDGAKKKHGHASAPASP
jgi:hypothetical protein